MAEYALSGACEDMIGPTGCGSAVRIASGSPQPWRPPVRRACIAEERRCCWLPRGRLWPRPPAAEPPRARGVYSRGGARRRDAGGRAGPGAPRRCHVARSSVHRWLRQYGARRDATALADRPRSGRPRRSGRLTPRRLAAVLERDPRRCSDQATRWTVPLLAHYLAAQDGITIGAQRSEEHTSELQSRQYLV